MRLTHLKVLSEKELSNIHQASLRVLSETGVVIHSEKVLRLLKDHGAKVDVGKEQAWIPESFILEALSSVPSKIRFYNRDKGHYFALGEQNNCLVGSGFDAVYVLDYETGERRKAAKEDLGKFARLSDALDNIDIVAVPAILFYGALQRIPQELYEAAYIGGTSRWQCFRFVTIPLLRETTTVVSLYCIIGGINMFDLFWVMTQGGPAHATELLSTWAVFQAFKYFNMGYGATLVVVVFITVVLFNEFLNGYAFSNQ